MTTISTVIAGTYLPTQSYITIQQGAGITAAGTFALYIKVGSDWTVVNDGLLAAHYRWMAGQYAPAVSMDGGTLINTGTIYGYATGIEGGRGRPDIVNSGAIAGTSATYRNYMENDHSIQLDFGGEVTNLPGGTIEYGVRLGTNSTLVNEGYIDGFQAVAGGIGYYVPHGRGVVFNGYVVNGDGARIRGYVEGVGTVVNAGTIGYGTTGYGRPGMPAVDFYAGEASTLVLEPGSVLLGLADGGNTIGSTVTSSLVFATGAGRGTFSYGLFDNFGAITVESGAAWTETGANNLVAGQSLTQAGVLYVAGTMVNDGDITAVTTALYVTTGTVINTGTISGGSNIGVEVGDASLLAGGYIQGASYGIAMTEAGTVVVPASGWVSGGDGIVGVGDVTVAGRVAGTAAVDPNAVSFMAGVSSHLVVMPGASFVGQVYGGYMPHRSAASGLEFASAGGAGTMAGLGQQYQSFASVTIDAGATWTATAAGSIGTYAAVLVAGTFDPDGLLANAGTISVAADGVIAGAGFGGVVVAAGGSLAVAGTVIGAAYGVDAAGGGMVTNTGTIDGASYGVELAGARLTNAGTIAASEAGGDAVSMAAGYAGYLAVDPSAVFAGTVDGGNTVGAGAVSTLVFAAGTTAGTFSGLGTRYVNFGDIEIAAGGTWTAAGDNTLLAGQTLLAPGSLDIAGNLIVLGSFSQTGGLTLSGGTFETGNTISGSTYGAVATDELLSLAPGGAILATGTISEGGALPAGVRLDASTFVNGGYAGGQAYGAIGGDTIVNLAGATLSGGRAGVYAHGTLINYGLVEATGLRPGDPSPVAALMPGGTPNLVVVEPGASFAGVVDGGNPIGGTVASTLVFAAASVQGTFAGLGSHYVDFRDVTVGAYAFWKAEGTNTLAAGETLSLHGALTLAGTLVNQGLVTTAPPVTYFTPSGYLVQADGYGISMAGGTLVNGAGGVIEGEGYGVAGRGVVIDAGTIGSQYTPRAIGYGPPTGYALTFAPGAGNRLVVDPGAVFQGIVSGGNTYGSTAQSVLELASGASAGTLDGLGIAGAVTGFGAVTIDAGADWTLAGITNLYGVTLEDAGSLTVGGSLALGGTLALEGTGRVLRLAQAGIYGPRIEGLAHNTVELLGTVEALEALGDGHLTLSGGAVLNIGGAYNLGQVAVTSDGGDTFITACFASGTGIATARGRVVVEELREGERVLTASGRLAPVRWIGWRRTDLRRHPRPHDVMPVRVTAGAFGRSLPGRDLVLSPDHAVFVDGALVPVRHLVNGDSIRQEARESITYWHVELDRHDVVLAEGLACETYLDTGNRGAFENAGGAVELHPAFSRPRFARAVWARAGCAPILTDPAAPALRAVHLRLLARGRRERSAAG